jgi:hypothetical protein
MAAPTTELGTLNPRSLPGISSFHVDDVDTNPLWSDWRRRTETCDEMLNDAQIDTLRDVIQLPLRRRTWGLDPNGAADPIVARLSADYGLPVLRRMPDGLFELDGDLPNVARLTGRFSFREHVEEALDAPWYGFYPFEQVAPLGADGLYHLRKLAARPPRQITDMPRDADGGLAGIRMTYSRTPGQWQPELIPLDRLVFYIWGKRGDNWTGRSWLRSIYREWVLKDRNMRMAGIVNERNGMGVPWFTGPPGASDEDLRKLAATAAAYRGGEEAGGAGPNGSDFKLVGVSGTLPDILAHIKYADEQMARRFLAMMVMLGQTQTGSRALGETFNDYLALALDAVAEWVCEVFTQHVIEDDVDWNEGELVTNTPRLASVTHAAPEAVAQEVAPLTQAVDSGALVVDGQVGDAITANRRLTRHGRPWQGWG